MSDLLNLDLSSAQKSLKNREISSVELTKAYLDAIEKTSSLGAYIDLQKDYALEMAKNSDKKINQGVAGPLEGIPIGVKDMFCTKDIKTTASSNILENFYPTYESTVTQNLWNDGAVMLGKLSCDEFAMGSSNETAAKGNVINPWSKTIPMSPGGSSGGSAAAVASRSALAATGTDTGGSIRQPAAFCGITGLKPTYGRCSRWGIVAFSSSLDQAGPLTRTVSDAAVMLNSMAGYDNKDSTSANLEMPDLTSYLDKSIKGKKIGIPKEYTQDGISKDIVSFYETSIQFLKDSGAEIIPVSLPHTKYALPVYYIIAPAEASSNLARYDGVRYGTRKEAESLDDMSELTRGEGFGDEVQIFNPFHLDVRCLYEVAIQRTSDGHVWGVARLLDEENAVFLLLEDFEGVGIISRRNRHFEEQFMHRFGRGFVDGAVADKHPSKCRDGVAGEGVSPCIQHRWPRGKTTGVVVLEHGKRRVV